MVVRTLVLGLTQRLSAASAAVCTPTIWPYDALRVRLICGWLSVRNRLALFAASIPKIHFFQSVSDSGRSAIKFPHGSVGSSPIGGTIVECKRASGLDLP